ncbi:MAG: GTPase HflX, partial [Ignavibacteriae bacterium]|nr:GTPase HflX [Ignavibacteriota bacterium]
MIQTKKEAEKTVLVFFARKNDNVIKIKESLEELELLSTTAGAKVVKTFYQVGESFDSRYMIGKGKAEEIANYVEEKEISLVIFENELSFTQLRNLEQKIKCKILDKSNLILDIFAKNARTSQAKLQVELAQLEYLLPRLTRQWTHLSKQYGGIGTKGPGETQIETDRRLIKTRISVLKEKLEKIDRQRKTQSLERKNYIRLSLVGYTNAGKSTLLNLLTDSDVYVEDKLFATLDTSTRMLKLNNAKVKKIVSRFPKKVLISDTVGFIKNLPHNLIESFKSTLSEVVESDILLHVIDISNPNFEEQISVVKDTLDEIGAGDRKIINVFNKVDKLNDFELLNHLKEEYPESVFISAHKGLNVESLLNKVKDQLSK